MPPLAAVDRLADLGRARAAVSNARGRAARSRSSELARRSRARRSRATCRGSRSCWRSACSFSSAGLAASRRPSSRASSRLRSKAALDRRRSSSRASPCLRSPKVLRDERLAERLAERASVSVDAALPARLSSFGAGERLALKREVLVDERLRQRRRRGLHHVPAQVRLPGRRACVLASSLSSAVKKSGTRDVDRLRRRAAELVK